MFKVACTSDPIWEQNPEWIHHICTYDCPYVEQMQNQKKSIYKIAF